MLKKLFVLITLLIGSSSIAFDFSNETIDISNIKGSERFEFVQNIKDFVVVKNYNKKLTSKEFKNIVSSHKKDKNYPFNYYATQCGYDYLRGNILAPVYYNNSDIMLFYSVQEQQNQRIVYDYSIIGNLKYIHLKHENYPNFPYLEKTYKTNGKFVNSTYYINETSKIKFNKKGNIAEIYNNNNLLEKIKI